jgi:hypothetical protein
LDSHNLLDTACREIDPKTGFSVACLRLPILVEEVVHRRVGTAIGLAVVSLGIGALMLLSKSKKHFVGLTWVDGDKKGGFVMQCDKNDYRGILVGLEGVTGKKAVDSDALTVKN